MKKILFDGLVSILICVIATAVVIGVWADGFKVYDVEDGRYTFKTYVKSVITVLIYFIVAGYWLWYIPAIIAYARLVEYVKSETYTSFIIIGVFIGAVSCTVYLFLQGELTSESWYMLPHGPIAITIPTFALVGAMYGLVYRKWLFKVGVKVQ